MKTKDLNTTTKQPVLSKADHDTIMSYIKNGETAAQFNRADAEELLAEIKRARIVSDKELPADVIRLNSVIHLRDKTANKQMQLILVTPKQANIKEKKISVMSPVGIALIGCRKGQQVKWRVPIGERQFLITDVHHQPATDYQ
jgi:regulator of nucleoside diphosphate kinase